jgi:hypothetical protein
MEAGPEADRVENPAADDGHATTCEERTNDTTEQTRLDDEEFEELPSPDTEEPGGYLYGLHLTLNGKDVKLVQDIVAAVVAGGPPEAGGDGLER